jgi:hypothetical protein
MAHGMKILTRDGLVDIADVRIGKLIFTTHQTIPTGSVSFGFTVDVSTIFAFATANDGKATPAISSISSTGVGWDTTTGVDVSSDFTIYIIRYK